MLGSRGACAHTRGDAAALPSVALTAASAETLVAHRVRRLRLAELGPRYSARRRGLDSRCRRFLIRGGGDRRRGSRRELQSSQELPTRKGTNEKLFTSAIEREQTWCIKCTFIYIYLCTYTGNALAPRHVTPYDHAYASGPEDCTTCCDPDAVLKCSMFGNNIPHDISARRECG